MTSTTALEILSRPLILTEIKEVQVCLGHKKFIREYKNYSKAKESGLSWENDAKKDPIFKTVSFIINELRHKRYKLYHCFEHVDNVNCCDHHKIEVIRKTYDLVVKQIFEKAHNQDD